MKITRRKITASSYDYFDDDFGMDMDVKSAIQNCIGQLGGVWSGVTVYNVNGVDYYAEAGDLDSLPEDVLYRMADRTSIDENTGEISIWV